MISTICSQTILQKSAKVFGKGPEGHKMIITTHFILGVFQNTKAQLTQKSLKKNGNQGSINDNKTILQYIS